MNNNKLLLHVTNDKSDILNDQMVKEKHEVNKASLIGMRY